MTVLRKKVLYVNLRRLIGDPEPKILILATIEVVPKTTVAPIPTLNVGKPMHRLFFAEQHVLSP